MGNARKVVAKVYSGCQGVDESVHDGVKNDHGEGITLIHPNLQRDYRGLPICSNDLCIEATVESSQDRKELGRGMVVAEGELDESGARYRMH